MLITALNSTIIHGFRTAFLANATRSFRILERVPYALWFNLGIAHNQFSELPIIAYLNGEVVQVDESITSHNHTDMSVRTDTHWIRLGGSQTGNSLTNASMNDLVIWVRALTEFESHRFLGYSHELTIFNGQICSQYNLLTSASYYWTTDPYISQDGLTQIDARLHPNIRKYLTPVVDHSKTGLPGYALASLYKSYRGEFHYSSLDQLQKSLVPRLRMKSDHYLILGKRHVHSTVNYSVYW
ncbi:hypothetical protein EG68_03611 [Paragonimus skrjabini miyazakii]|uniref:Uncharacterized protein n=1 Tax=Paragonimus skrjabini miyazakii TaxID=59628 RepID=A0A8S9YXH9_9TREM|nr:hypothetical protein EG68_03611 [Paragonimus skrjabini miyazakii]